MQSKTKFCVYLCIRSQEKKNCVIVVTFITSNQHTGLFSIMSKANKWQLSLILIVIGLTIYNILPTLFFYSQPLNQPVSKKKGTAVAENIMNRVNYLQEDALSYLASFNKMLSIKAKKIESPKEDPSLIFVSFSSEKEADLFKKFLPARRLSDSFLSRTA